ncbi:MAG: TonB-dependent receptor plug domain-containing protein [Bacteroidia bacterium]|nr:TonB-dependent receptor plug domain-containing protein [Bacteroidia bacterium]MBT8269049.1 TonB-dependent receptor plug domain-containing protein [Bacteroidia bacterium]NNL79250.1 TonB-dependent receptor plug domain-containing protein [Flavobacteriaceae bacterium]
MIRLILFLLLLGSVSVTAQNTLLGKVMNFNDEPIVNAAVYLDGQLTEIRSNQRGYFEIVVPEGTKLIQIISQGYGLLTTEYTGSSKMNFVYLNYEPEQEEVEKANIGYGNVARKNLTYSIQELEIDDRDQAKGFVNIYDLIRARASGVVVTDDNRIYVRGKTSIQGSSQPIFVVDGVIVESIDFVLPSEVKDIDVLKDAAASIYGSRGANGVILITLKN